MEEIRFEKTVRSVNKTATAIIILKSGINFKGNYMQRLNQVNTANEEVNKNTRKFEELQITVDDMSKLIISQGYKIVSND